MRALDPVWNEKHDIDVVDAHDILELSVYDYDVLGDDDFMGKVSSNFA